MDQERRPQAKPRLEAGGGGGVERKRNGNDNQMTEELKLKQSLELEVQLCPDAQHILICNYDDARQIATFELLPGS